MNQNAQVKAFFDRTELYLHKPFGVRLRALIARRMLGPIEQLRILDVGCGDGGVSLQFLESGNTLTLLDISDNMLALARQGCPQEYIENVRFINRDVLEYEPEKGYDVILCFGVLAHVPDVLVTLKHLSSLLYQGGVCLLQFTDQMQWLSRLQWSIYNMRLSREKSGGYKVNWLTRFDIAALLEEINLDIVDSVQYSFMFPGMGRLPDKWLYHYQRFTLENKWFSGQGTDFVLKLKKNEKRF